MTLTIAKWTVAEYHQMIAAGILVGRRVELLNGEIVEMLPIVSGLTQNSLLYSTSSEGALQRTLRVEWLRKS